MEKKKPSFSLKDQLLNREKIIYLSGLIKKAYPKFSDKDFENIVIKKFPSLELKERIYYIAEVLEKYLPDSFEESIKILLKSLPDFIENGKMDNNFGDFIFAPYCEFLLNRGCTEKYLQFSFKTLEIFTIYFSGEFIIRKFYNNFEKETHSWMLEMSTSQNYHHRRLASEGSRAKLPWGINIELDYRKTVEILNNLFYDKSRYVTRSVANHLNDISKIDPELVINILKKWKKTSKSEDLNYIISHSTRTLVKLGDKNTLKFLGYSSNPNVNIINFGIKESDIIIGNTLEFYFDIIGNNSNNLIVDYKIYFIGKNGKLLPKVFKLKKLKINKIERIIKKHKLRQMSTKTLYIGNHVLEIIINGKSFGKKEFKLV